MISSNKFNFKSFKIRYKNIIRNEQPKLYNMNNIECIYEIFGIGQLELNLT